MAPVLLSPPDGGAFGFHAGDLRRRMGARLAEKLGTLADVVCNPPGFDALGEGFAVQSGMPQRKVFLGAAEPWPIDRNAVLEQRVVMVCPSFSLSGSIPRMVARLRQAGAREVHLRLALAPLVQGCNFGVKTPVVAADAGTTDLVQQLGIDSILVLGTDELAELMGANGWCQACFGGTKPVVADQTDDQLLLFQASTS